MCHFYFVDLENVHAGGLVGSGHIHKKDKVVVFYSKNATPRIPFNVAQEIALSKGTFVFKEVVKLGKDALDKVLIKEVKRCLKKKGNTTYHIVSNDKGYIKEFRDVSNVVFQKKIG